RALHSPFKDVRVVRSLARSARPLPGFLGWGSPEYTLQRDIHRSDSRAADRTKYPRDPGRRSVESSRSRESDAPQGVPFSGPDEAEFLFGVLERDVMDIESMSPPEAGKSPAHGRFRGVYFAPLHGEPMSY